MDLAMLDLSGHPTNYAVISFGAYRAAVELDGGLEGGTLWVHPVSIPEGRSRNDAFDYLRLAMLPQRLVKGLKVEWIRAIRRRDVDLKLTESTRHEDEILAALSEVL